MLTRAGAIAQRRQRVGGLARLRYKERRATLVDRRLAIAELGGDIDIDRQAGVALEPVFGDEAGIIGRSAGRDGEPRNIGEIERQGLAQCHLLGAHVHIVAERMGDGLGLFVDFLGHEMAVVALVDHQRRGLRDERFAADDGIGAIADDNALGGDHGPVAVEQIAQPRGERGERHGVRAQIHLGLAIADGERRAVAGGDQQPVMALEHESEREGAAQLLERAGNGHLRIEAAVDLTGDPERDGLSVGLRLGQIAVLGEIGEQLAEILDDAVMDDGDLVGGMRVGVAFRGGAMRRPAGVADTDASFERLDTELGGEIAELALGATPGDGTLLQCRYPGAVIAAIFEALQRVDKARRDRLGADDPDNSTHQAFPLLDCLAAFLASAFSRNTGA